MSDQAALSAQGFHRIGRIDAVGRRSLWLREESDAIELRAGREGCDDRVRIERDNPLYRDIHSVMSTARFAAEWEVEGGTALDASYALDRFPDSIHRTPAGLTQLAQPAVRLSAEECRVLLALLDRLIAGSAP